MNKQALAASASENALSTTLRRILGRAQRHNRPPQQYTSPLSEIDIVSPKLCDDVLRFIAPSLEKHKGCTLIDVNPGACVFSSRLHDFLKPKRHLLMEPDQRYFEPFIKPLLEGPDSAYRHTTLRGAYARGYWQNYEKIFDDSSLLPPRVRLAEDDPKRRELDPSILVIGNLGRRMGSPNRHRTAPGTTGIRTQVQPLILYHMACAALSNTLMHRDGLVRMLWWAPDEVKAHFFATGVERRQPYSAMLEIGVTATEVAGVHSLYDYLDNSSNKMVKRHRYPAYDAASEAQVAERMEKFDIRPAEGRALQKVGLVEGANYTDTPTISPFASRVKTVAELQQKIDDAVAWANELDALRGKEGRHYSMDKLEYPQCSALLDDYRQSQAIHHHRNACLLDLNLRLFNIEVNLQDFSNHNLASQETQAFLRRQFDALEVQVSHFFKTATPRGGIAVTEMLDQQIAFNMSPPFLLRDRRPFEPLQASNSDFWPPYGLTLLDMLPKSRDLSVPDLASRKEATETCQEMIKTLFSARTMPLPQALERVAVNAGKDLIPMVPAITDPLRGGRLNPMNVRVRMLTEEMIEGLVKAFYEWPFRPAAYQLALEGEEVGTEAEAGEDASVENMNTSRTAKT